jgi:hypothetical protein
VHAKLIRRLPPAYSSFVPNTSMSFRFDPSIYGPALAPLLKVDRRRELGPGSPDRNRRSELESLTVEIAFAHTKLIDDDMAACCVSGVWLLHDFLDESHTISQSIETPSGSYWHAIMHRREGDFFNSKYWYRRVGRHPVIERVSEQLGSAYDPFAFVDRCEAAVRGKGEGRDACLDIQQTEWELLFDYCYRNAIDA